MADKVLELFAQNCQSKMVLFTYAFSKTLKTEIKSDDDLDENSTLCLFTACSLSIITRTVFAPKRDGLKPRKRNVMIFFELVQKYFRASKIENLHDISGA